MPNLSNTSPVSLWLTLCIALVAAMVFVGGYTRLSGSGLSITEWKPIHGVMPPLSDAEWNKEFEKYQQIPQYRQVNQGMTVEEFKTIFWPEYFHRLLGRAIGIVFLLPLIFFRATGRLDNKMTMRLFLIFALGALQGLMGWIMVHSGLSERLYVSHIRLTAHLSLAFLLGALLMWTWGDVRYSQKQKWRTAEKPARSFNIFLLLLSLQIIFGALLAGLHGGLIYNTFPDMNGALIPAETFDFQGPWWENIALIQFLHRWTAKALAIFLIFWWWKQRAYVKKKPASYAAAQALALLVTLQIFAGIFTLLYAAPLVLALMHQMLGFLLVLAATNVAYQLRKNVG